MSSTQLILSRPPHDASVVLGHCSLDEMISKNAACVTKGSDTNSGFVHRTSIHVQEDTLSNVHSVVIAVAIVFNLALAHHLTGVENSCNPVLLQTAVKLYERALALAQTEDYIGDDSVLFHLAIMNNLGQLYKGLKRNMLAGKCFHQLLSMLMYLLDCSEDDTPSYERFFSNVSHLIFPSGSVAAPAA